MICSVLLPSRGRSERLYETIKSLWHSCDPEQFEILLGLDDDDEVTLRDWNNDATEFNNIRCFVRPRGRGYVDLSKRLTDLANHGRARWCWIMNDDCTVTGNWVKELAKLPVKGCIAHPLHHRLNESLYTNDATGAFPFFPNGCWEDWGYRELGPVADKWLNETREKQGWIVRFLDGVEISHQRIRDEVLLDHDPD